MSISRQEAIAYLRENGGLPERLENLLALEESGKISKEEVNKELAKQAQREEAIEKHGDPSFVGSSLRHAARTGKNVAQGIASVADIPNLAALGLYAAGLKDTPEFYKSRAEKVGKYIDRVTNDYTVPHSDNEEIADMATQAVATLPGMQAAGVAAKAAKLAKVGKGLKRVGAINPASVASSGASGAVAETLLQEHPDKPYLSLLASMGVGAGTGAATNAVGRAGKINKEALRAFQEAGIPFGYGDVALSPRAQMNMTKLPIQIGAQNVMTKHIEKQKHGIKKGLGNIEHNALKEGQREAVAVKGAENTLMKKKAQHSRRYDKHRENLKKLPDDSIEMKNVYEWIESLSPEMRAEILTGKRNSSKKLRELMKISEEAPNIDYSRPLNEIMADIDKAKTQSVPKLSYEMHHHKTSDIGKHVKTDKAQMNYTDAELSTLYGKMKEDERAIGERLLKHAGKDAYENWRRMGGMYKDYAVEEVPHLNKMLENAKKAERADASTGRRYTSKGHEYAINQDIMKDIAGEGKGVQLVLEGLASPVERNKLTKAILEQLGQVDGEMSFIKLQHEFDKLSGQAKKTLLKGLGEEKRNFLNSLIAARKFKKLHGQANPTGTARNPTLLGIPKSIYRYGKAKYLTSPEVLDFKLASREKGATKNAILDGALRGLINGS